MMFDFKNTKVGDKIYYAGKLKDNVNVRHDIKPYWLDVVKVGREYIYAVKEGAKNELWTQEKIARNESSCYYFTSVEASEEYMLRKTIVARLQIPFRMFGSPKFDDVTTDELKLVHKLLRIDENYE